MTEPVGRSALGAAATLVLALSALVLGGCSGTAARKASQARLSAIGHNQRGVEEKARGNDAGALAEFSEALRLHGSIENLDGMVVALINIARTQRLQGDLPKARSSIERACSLLQDPSELAPELFFEKAKILLAAGELADAKDWAVRALARDKGDSPGRRANLVATILFRMGLPEQAREEAEQALKLSRDGQLAGEEANSLRLLGEIHLAQGRHESATNAFQGALLLDKELGFGRKIASDLRGLGSAALKKNDLPGAIGYYRRVMELSLNGADAGLAADDMTRLAELYRRNGETALAQKLADDRKKLP